MTLDSALRIDFRKISKETENQIANCCNNNNNKKAAAVDSKRVLTEKVVIRGWSLDIL